MMRPTLMICADTSLYSSFFGPEQESRLKASFELKLCTEAQIGPELEALLSESNALITTWDSPHFDGRLPQLALNLRVIGHCGGEVKGRFAPELFDRLTITNAPGPMAQATAELGAAFLVYCARNVDFYRVELRKTDDRIYSQKHADGSIGETLSGREVSMIGLGRVGRALIELLRGFNIRWNVYDPYSDVSSIKDAQNLCTQASSLDEMLQKSELLVLTAALTEETRGLLDRKRLAMLPDDAVLINIARGRLVDLDALTEEITSGRLRCALDVTDPVEPLPLCHPLRTLPNAIVTPHIAASDLQVRRAIADTVIDDLERFFRGEMVANRVTRAMLDRMT